MHVYSPETYQRKSHGIYFSSCCKSILDVQDRVMAVMHLCIMMPSHGIIFRVTGHLCGEFICYRFIPRTKGQWRGALMFSLICAWINGWLNNREVGDLRCPRLHYDAIVMYSMPADNDTLQLNLNKTSKRCPIFNMSFMSIIVIFN